MSAEQCCGTTVATTPTPGPSAIASHGETTQAEPESLQDAGNAQAMDEDWTDVVNKSVASMHLARWLLKAPSAHPPPHALPSPTPDEFVELVQELKHQMKFRVRQRTLKIQKLADPPPICKLPVEVLEQVGEHLNPSDMIMLSLSCKKLFRDLQYELLDCSSAEYVRLVIFEYPSYGYRFESRLWKQRRAATKLLDKDRRTVMVRREAARHQIRSGGEDLVVGEQVLYCNECGVLHPREYFHPVQQPVSATKRVCRASHAMVKVCYHRGFTLAKLKRMRFRIFRSRARAELHQRIDCLSPLLYLVSRPHHGDSTEIEVEGSLWDRLDATARYQFSFLSGRPSTVAELRRCIERQLPFIYVCRHIRAASADDPPFSLGPGSELARWVESDSSYANYTPGGDCSHVNCSASFEFKSRRWPDGDHWRYKVELAVTRKIGNLQSPWDRDFLDGVVEDGDELRALAMKYDVPAYMALNRPREAGHKRNRYVLNLEDEEDEEEEDEDEA